MTLTALPARGCWWGDFPFVAEDQTTTFFASSLQIDATGEKAAFVGRFRHPSGGSRNIRKIHFRTGVIVSAGGSAIDISLQDLSAAAGPPPRPDETQDQKVASVLLSALTASAWNTTANLSADRTINDGDPLCVVFEFDGAGRLGADSLIIATPTGRGRQYESPVTVLKTGGTWAIPSSGQMPNVIFECDDGSFGTLDESMPCSALSSVAYNSGSGADEYAMPFDVPVELAIDALKVNVQAAASADFDVVLYSGTTALVTKSFDANAVASNSANDELFVALGSNVTLSPATTYYIAVKPTTANNVTVFYFDVNATGHLAVLPGGSNWQMSSRVDAGAWANYGSNKRRMRAAFRVSQIHGAGGGGGAVGLLNRGLIQN